MVDNGANFLFFVDHTHPYNLCHQPLPRVMANQKFGLASILEHKTNSMREAAAVVVGMVLHRAHTKAGGTLSPMSPGGQLLIATQASLKRVVGGRSSSPTSSTSDLLRCANHYVSTLERICDSYPYILNDAVVETLCVKMNLLNGDDRVRPLVLDN